VLLSIVNHLRRADILTLSTVVEISTRLHRKKTIMAKICSLWATVVAKYLSKGTWATEKALTEKGVERQISKFVGKWVVDGD
jgi:hypothetical protein